MSSNSRDSVEIPGYYYDPHVRRYFKIDPAHPRPPATSASESESQSIAAKFFKPRPKHTIDILQKREIGVFKCSFVNSVVALRLKHLQCVKEIDLDCPHRPVQNVTFLKGGRHCVYVQLFCEISHTNFIKQRMHFLSPNASEYPTTDLRSVSPVEYRIVGHLSVVDLCESSNPLCQMVAVCSDSRVWKVNVSCASTRESTPLVSSKMPIWCCTANDFTSQLAWGKKDCVVLCVLPSTETFYGKRIQGEVRSIEFDKQGNLIYTGVHTGHIEVLDNRTNARVFRKRLHNIGIDETVLLYDEKRLICGAFDGKLFNLDLRMRKLICEYYGHVHSPSRKVPFSLSESHDLLCATGSDNVTRLWSLSSGGNPVKHLRPPKKKQPCRSWLVSDGCKFLVYQYQRENCYIYGNDMLEH